ncbi:YeeE/YedE family protein [Yersinia aleksiciae]|uniref:Gene II and x proteins n=1 Tax=Yersinia aleksiciae TaxID=263819 RepID=A0A0T9TYZ9_YERAE|nr:YeeE/YedE family protein [Yersinia aleksiciae]AKP32990.1 membrane protein [Yersinia aleksiciae]MDA5499075.1 YeeE/YedE family protein [Yersinia aleksiciae]NIL00776.1 YeeE/YedE family protein [Yersinia aleksiciae]WQC71359.1 YeeE/YedE family protein [Yersinia aleksiciae]CFQ55011.1 gene II and x proteins [Yersinia aleksiciae]
MNLLFSLLAGLLFGLGLIVAGMANPAKVLGFLDISRQWDPSLGLVMAAAVLVATIGFGWAKKRGVSLLGQPLQWPTSTHIDRRLIGGSLLFGIGWGLAGICPGPALVLLGAGMIKGIIFVAAMLLGMALFSLIERYRQR